jgi:hypothetical protein
MSKQVKIQVVNNGQASGGFFGMRDTTVGKVYNATWYNEGEDKDIDNSPAGADGVQFVDDVGDKVFIHYRLGMVEVVEG